MKSVYSMREREESNMISRILTTGKMERLKENQFWRDMMVLFLEFVLDIQVKISKDNSIHKPQEG